jgi:hypothetical protein
VQQQLLLLGGRRTERRGTNAPTRTQINAHIPPHLFILSHRVDKRCICAAAGGQTPRFKKARELVPAALALALAQR